MGKHFWKDLMDICFANEEVRELALSFVTLVKRYGKQKGKKIRQRLDEIHAAANLDDLYSLLDKKCRCHPENHDILQVQTVPNSYILITQANTNLRTNFTDTEWSQVEAVSIITLDGDAT